MFEGFTHTEWYTPEIVVSHCACPILKDKIDSRPKTVKGRNELLTLWRITVTISVGHRATVVDIRQSTRTFTWYNGKRCSEMSTLQSTVLNMSAIVKKSSRLGRETSNVFQKIERP